MMNQVPLTVLLCGLCVLPWIHGVSREYHFVDLRMNWPEAQQHCREHYTDLATVTNEEEANRLNRTGTNTEPAWIGLFDDPASWRGVMTSDPNSWRWSATGTTSAGQYQNWTGSNPDHWTLDEKCVEIYSDGFWNDLSCCDKLHFICYTDGKPKTFHPVHIRSTWDQAKAYCRTHHTDLAMIETKEENSNVTSFLVENTWIGLYREPWRWSDNTPSSFRNWESVGSNIIGHHCAAENTAHLWYPQFCNQSLPFFCHRDLHPKKKSTVVKMNFRSALDMTDPKNYKMIVEEIEKQLKKTGHPGVKVTFKTPPKKKKKTEL